MGPKYIHYNHSTALNYLNNLYHLKSNFNVQDNDSHYFMNIFVLIMVPMLSPSLSSAFTC